MPILCMPGERRRHVLSRENVLVFNQLIQLHWVGAGSQEGGWFDVEVLCERPTATSQVCTQPPPCIHIEGTSGSQRFCSSAEGAALHSFRLLKLGAGC